MSQTLPEIVDPWRMVASRRRFEGAVPLSALSRLSDGLAGVAGEAVYVLEFGTDSFGTPFLEVDVQTALPLICQRSLERFLYPVRIQQRMGLIRREEDEAALPPGYEALLVSREGMHLLDVVEDELILAIPVVPVNPDIAPVELIESEEEEEVVQPEERPSPFAALASLKKQ